MKERLTGAIILVVLVVALVPELLSGPKPTAAPKALATTDGAPIRQVEIELSEPAAPAGATLAAPTPAPTPAPAVAPPPPPAAVLSSSAAPPSAPAPAPTAAPAPRVAPIERPAPAHEPAAAPVAQSAAQPAAGHDVYVVQAGTFSSRGNAERLAHQLESRGLKAHVSSLRLGGRSLFRVRVGPAGDRATAIALLGRVKPSSAGATIVAAP